MRVVPYEPQHAMAIKLQSRQWDILSDLTPEYAESLKSGPAITFLEGDDPVACIGKVQMWRGRWIVWAMLSCDACKHLVQLTRTCKRLLTTQDGEGRLEVMVRSDFPQAHRWARMLGFTLHHHEERFLPDGADADIYVRFT